MGAIFGRGSRNNFANAFGGMVEGISNLIFKLPKLREPFGVFKPHERVVRPFTEALGKQFGWCWQWYGLVRL